MERILIKKSMQKSIKHSLSFKIEFDAMVVDDGRVNGSKLAPTIFEKTFLPKLVILQTLEYFCLNPGGRNWKQTQ